MCGIGGVWFGKTVDRVLLRRLILKCELRGADAFGATILSWDGGRKTFKAVGRASAAIEGKEWEQFINQQLRPHNLLVFNTRAQPLTEPESKNANTVQPVESGRFVVVHNGVVANDFELTKDENLIRNSPIDSEVIPLLVEKYGIPMAFSKMSGGYAVALAEQNLNHITLHLIKDFKTLAYGYDASTRAFAFASEKAFLEEAFLSDFGMFFTDTKMEDLPPYSLTTINFEITGPVILSKTAIRTKSISSLPPTKASTAVVCASGGIDSTTAAYVAKKVHGCKDVIMVHFDHGQKSEKCEWNAVRHIARELGARAELINLSWLGALGNSVLTDPELPVPHAEPKNIKSTICWTPARNLTMMSALASVAESFGAAHIYAGWSLEEEGSYPDNSIDFFKAFNSCLDYGTIARPKIRLPLARLMKKETVLLGEYLEVPYHLTWSCDDGDLKGHCGRCGACFLHHYSFVLAGIPDPTKYANPLEFPFTPPWEREGFTAVPVPMATILRKV